MKILFEGFYGFKNTGDDAFVEVSSWGSEKYWNCKNNVFLGASLPKTITNINVRQILPNIKGFDRLNLIAHLSNSDYFISSGGSTFSEIPIHSNKMLSKHYKNIRKKLKSGAIGVSVGPFKDLISEKRTIKYLQSLDFLALRDHRSYLYAKSLNLPYEPVNAFDLAALLPRVYNSNYGTKQVKDNNKKIIGLSICNYESYTGGNISKEKNRNTFFKELVELIDKAFDCQFKLFIINGNNTFGDSRVSLNLIKDINNDRVTIIPYGKNVKAIWEEISICDLMISTRLHASIFACYANVPFLLIEYHKKCTDFLMDIGQNNDYRLYDAGVSPKEVMINVHNILNFSYKRPENVEKTINLSEKNFSSFKMI